MLFQTMQLTKVGVVARNSGEGGEGGGGGINAPVGVAQLEWCRGMGSCKCTNSSAPLHCLLRWQPHLPCVGKALQRHVMYQAIKIGQCVSCHASLTRPLPAVPAV
jgi:hypothetical protein